MNVSNRQLADLVASRSLVSIERKKIDSRSLQAIPIRYSPKLLLVQYVHDFHLDGQLILRRKDITSITCGATNHFQHGLLHDHGLIAEIDFDFVAELASFSALLNSQPEHSIVILENEGLDDSQFWIGRYVDSDKGNVRLHEFSGAANWNEELTRIDQHDITCCQLNTNYIQYYAGYFQARKPPPLPA